MAEPGGYDPLPDGVSGYHVGEEPGNRHTPPSDEVITVTADIKARLDAVKANFECPNYSVAIGILLDYYQRV